MKDIYIAYPDMKTFKKLIAYILILMMILSACGETYKDSSAAQPGKETKQEENKDPQDAGAMDGQDSASKDASSDPGDPQNGPAESGPSESGSSEGSQADASGGEAADKAPEDDGKRTGGFTEAPEGYFDEVLIIGDSRCEGLKRYGGLEGPDWFTDVGLSVFNIDEKQIAMEEGAEAVSLDQVLEARQYRSVYIGLGINEIGCDMDITKDKFAELLDKVRSAQPDAVVFMMANIHVTAERSASDEIYNNERIEELNTLISMFADFDMVWYIDVNPLFDDASGALDSEKSFDDVHIFAKHYPEWAQFLREHAVLLKEGAV